MRTDLLAAITALIASLSLTPVATKLALYYGVVDHPGPRKLHVAPVPLWGGLAMYGGTILAIVLLAAEFDPATRAQIAAIVAGASLLVLVGSLDDRGLLHHQVKLFGAMPVAAVILIAAGIRANVFGQMFGDGWLWQSADIALTLLWVVGITAAFSILDHMDGLCAGVASVASAFFLFYAVASRQVLVGTLAAAVLGASLGFLRSNFSPARIFMGDGGAMFLGFMMATLGLKLRVPSDAFTAALVPVFILGVPVFDTTLVTISRTRRGLLPFASPGKDHTSHRLTALGLGHKRAVVALYGAGVLSGGMAIILGRAQTTEGLTLLAIASALAIAAVMVLERCSFERQESRAVPSSGIQ